MSLKKNRDNYSETSEEKIYLFKIICSTNEKILNKLHSIHMLYFADASTHVLKKHFMHQKYIQCNIK